MPRRSWAARLVVVLPYAWLAIFFLAPLLIVLKISLSQTAVAQPPYIPVFDLAGGWQGLRNFLAGLAADNYWLLLSDSLYFDSYLRSLSIALVSTLMLLLAGFPIAYASAALQLAQLHLLIDHNRHDQKADQHYRHRGRHGPVAIGEELRPQYLSDH